MWLFGCYHVAGSCVSTVSACYRVTSSQLCYWVSPKVSPTPKCQWNIRRPRDTCLNAASECWHTCWPIPSTKSSLLDWSVEFLVVVLFVVVFLVWNNTWMKINFSDSSFLVIWWKELVCICLLLHDRSSSLVLRYLYLKIDSPTRENWVCPGERFLQQTCRGESGIRYFVTFSSSFTNLLIQLVHHRLSS